MIPTFNNDGPIGTFLRYICDNGTYIARYDDLVDGYDKPVDLSGVAVSDNGIELEDREFFSTVSRRPAAKQALSPTALPLTGSTSVATVELRMRRSPDEHRHRRTRPDRQ